MPRKLKAAASPMVERASFQSMTLAMPTAKKPHTILVVALLLRGKYGAWDNFQVVRLIVKMGEFCLFPGENLLM